MLRFIVYAVPVLVLLLALFGFAVELLDAEPRSGSVIRLALFEQPRVPGQLVLGTWLVEASGLIALFLLTQGRFGAWWLDGLVAGWVGWIFRGPLLVVTIVVAARQPQDPWWTLAFGWWVLYSVCGLSLAILARRSGLEPWSRPDPEPALAAATGPPTGSSIGRLTEASGEESVEAASEESTETTPEDDLETVDLETPDRETADRETTDLETADLETVDLDDSSESQTSSEVESRPAEGATKEGSVDVKPSEATAPEGDPTPATEPAEPTEGADPARKEADDA